MHTWGIINYIPRKKCCGYTTNIIKYSQNIMLVDKKIINKLNLKRDEK